MVSTQQRYWTYILASQPRGTLYIGVTNNILGRVELHRAGNGAGFTSKYGVAMLVWFEEFDRVDEAIQREKSLKRYLRQWKINLIEQSNPQWIDLYPGLAARNDLAQEQADGWVLGTSQRMTFYCKRPEHFDGRSGAPSFTRGHPRACPEDPRLKTLNRSVC